MTKRKTFLLLAAAVIVVTACSLTNQATSGAALLSNEPRTPTARPQRADTQTPTTSPTRCTVTAHALNVRNCGGVDCGIIAQLIDGETVTVIERGDWLKVETEAGAAGFVNSNYCKSGE